MFAEEINDSKENQNLDEAKGEEKDLAQGIMPAPPIGGPVEGEKTPPAQEESTPEAKEQKIDPKKWYVIQTFSGQEEKVKRSLEHAIGEMNMGHKIFKVLVPEEEMVEIRGKKRIELKKKMFPGYIFIEMLLDDESWYVIRSIPGVAKFIGTKTKPTPVLDREMQRVLKQIGIKAERLEVNFETGETVRVISGPFRGYTGTINEINIDRGRLKVLINIFGRDTPVEVNFEHAQKIV